MTRTAPGGAQPLAALPGTEKIIPEGDARGDLPAWLTFIGFSGSLVAQVAGLGRFQLAPPLIYKALTAYTLLWAIMSAVDRTMAESFDRVGSAVGPAFLAINALNGFGRLTTFDAAAAGFGWFMVDHLPAFAYSRWVWLATLAAAVWKGLSAQWLVAAYGLGSLWRLGQAVINGDSKIRVQDALFAGLAGFALYKEAAVPMSLFIMGAHILASTVS